MGTQRDGGPLPLVAAKVRVPEVRALSRERLDRRLRRIWDYRLGLVVAPAGSGKSTLLAQFAATVSEPVAWYRAESSEGDARALLAYVQRALAVAWGGAERDGPWETVEDAARALEGRSGGRALLIIDDLHALRGSPAEAALGRLVPYLPPTLAVLAASRSTPGFDVTRLRVAGELLEIRADDLRFRSWEVERLFHEFYLDRYPPEELAELARRTEGWAAGLQLFHLATRDRRADERRGILAALNTRSQLVREYLAGNVLDQLPAGLRRFLLDTCVLGRLSGDVCDALTGRTDSAALLEYLVERQIFTFRVEADGCYRYHEVLRSHLSAALVDEVGEAEMCARNVRAGALLEATGAVYDALLAYCRGEDWQAVGRLLGHEGEQIAHDPGEWLDLLPPAMAEHPWVQLASARRRRAAGRWHEALDCYRRVESAVESHGAADIGRRERLALTAWLEPPLVTQPNWAGLVRQATVRDPRAARRRALEMGGPNGAMAAGLAALLAGDVVSARVELTTVAESAEASPALGVGARVAASAAAVLAGDDDAAKNLDAAAEGAARLGIPWLARLSRSLFSLRVAGVVRIDLRGSAERSGDPWAYTLDALVEGLGALHAAAPMPSELLDAARQFGDLGAHVLQSWCLAVRALGMARDDSPGALAAATEAEALARTRAVPGAWALAQLALARCLPEQAAALLDAAQATADECGLFLPCLDRATADSHGEQPAPVIVLRCFGGLALSVDERPVDLGGVRPRVRSLLRLLAVHGGRAVHREVIAEALWPDADLDVGTRGLHVAVSSLRRALHAVPGVSVERDGNAYRLALPDGAVVDVLAFDDALQAAAAARLRGERDAAIAAYQRALSLHEAELLPEEGPAEWVLGPRDVCRSSAAEAAQMLAELLFERGDAGAGALACQRGLEIDRYRDSLWRTLISGLEQAGDQAAAAHGKELYHEVLSELGLWPPAAQAHAR